MNRKKSIWRMNLWMGDYHGMVAVVSGNQSVCKELLLSLIGTAAVN